MKHILVLHSSPKGFNLILIKANIDIAYVHILDIETYSILYFRIIIKVSNSEITRTKNNSK